MKNKPPIPQIAMADFHYELPNEQIAMFPQKERDTSRLLVRKKRELSHEIYRNLPQLLPANALLVFNNTRVMAARLKFKKSTGGEIEVFLLEPADGNYASLHHTENAVWKCLIGGAKKWKNNEILHASTDQEKGGLKAELIEKKEDYFLVSFNWDAGMKFEKIVSMAGKIPLPPYIKREATTEDKNRYQTVYAEHEGSVAAPTAGLHFTDDLISALSAQNIGHAFVTLHVGAGTFKPVTAAVISDHNMHEEFFQVDIALIQQLADTEKSIIVVGTTSLRTLESLYWIGIKVLEDEHHDVAVNQVVEQWEYLRTSDAPMPSRKTVFTHLSKKMMTNGISMIQGYTGICIAPGYTFRVAGALITNFHQPQSTLLLIIAAIMGDDWKNMYATALENGYRFLSYGDGSLLFIDEAQ